jgi:hypothetical protein
LIVHPVKFFWREYELCALHIMCFLYIKNGWNFLLLYNIDDTMPFMWRTDNRHILAPIFYRMNLKYWTFHSWSSHFLYTCVYRSSCTLGCTFFTNNAYKCWIYMINNLTMVYKPMYLFYCQDNFLYNSTIYSQVCFSWLHLLVSSRCIRYTIMG